MSDELSSLISLLVQIPLVGAFMWFVLRIQDANNKERARLDALYTEAQEKRDNQFLQAIKDLQETHVLSISRIADEVKIVNSNVIANQALLNQHDNHMTIIANDQSQKVIDKLLEDRK